MFFTPTQTVVESAVEEAVNDKEETEPEQVFDYSYDSLKSGPKRVNISTDNMLELLYPLTTLVHSIVIIMHVCGRPCTQSKWLP